MNDPNFNIYQPTPQPIPPTDSGDQPTPDHPSRGRFLDPYRGLLSVVQLFVGALLLAFVINHFIFQSYEVFGESMAPTLHNGDRLVISKLSKSWSGVRRRDHVPARGEVVVFHNPRNPATQLVKRVFGLPGDRVVVRDGKVSVYTPEHPEGYNPDPEFGLEEYFTEGNVDVVVPSGEVFVIGDNRLPNGSYDSRSADLGTIPLEHVVGELTLRVFPLNAVKVF